MNEEWVKETISNMEKTKQNRCIISSKDLGSDLSFFYSDINRYINELDMLKTKPKLSEKDMMDILLMLGHVRSYIMSVDSDIKRVSTWCDRSDIKSVRRYLPRYDEFIDFEKKLRKKTFSKSDLYHLHDKLKVVKSNILDLDSDIDKILSD